MKRALPTTSQSPLRKKASSLFSISAIQDDNEGNEPTRIEKSANSSRATSRSSSSFGLNLLVHDDDDDEPDQDEDQPPIFRPKVLLQCIGLDTSTRSARGNVVPSVTPLSCTDDENEDSCSGYGIAKPRQHQAAAASLLQTAANFLPTDQRPPKHHQKAAEACTWCEEDTTTFKIVTDEKKKKDQVGDFRTGLVFEAGADHFDRHNRLHKERPLRITSIREALQKSKGEVFARCCVLGDEEEASSTHNPTATTTSASQFLDDEDYLRVHLPGYMQRLDKVFDCNCCKEERLDHEAEQYKSMYFTKDSLKEAKKAAVSLCSLVEKVVQKDLDNGFAVIRPPGHHAEPGLAGGYCVINNVAVAAAYARAKLGVEKILIVDWDVHHGNGTQSIFLKDPNVLYFSAHRWHSGNFFPFLSNGGPMSIGMGEGEGYNMNVGWTAQGMGDDEYLAVWERLLMPIAKEFNPDLILVSAGFDAADGDLGECHITPECYGRLTRTIMSLDTPIVCALEGGYVRSILGKCVCSVVSALLDRTSAEESKIEDDEDRRQRGDIDVLDTISSTAAKNIRATIAAHKAHWSCL